MDNIENNQQLTQPIVAEAVGDVTGDGYEDYVFLTGGTTKDSPFIQDITLHIMDGRTGLQSSIPLQTNVGYQPTLFLGDFTNDGVKDILISIASGGSGGIMYYYIYSYLYLQPKLIFDYNVFNQYFKYQVTYQDNYKVLVQDLTVPNKFMIDISLKDPDYLGEIYNPDGTLKQGIEGFVNPIGGLYPIDFDGNGVYELFIFQKVAGRYNADSLGYIQTIINWKNDQFNYQDQYLAIFGKS